MRTTSRALLLTALAASRVPNCSSFSVGRRFERKFVARRAVRTAQLTSRKIWDYVPEDKQSDDEFIDGQAYVSYEDKLCSDAEEEEEEGEAVPAHPHTHTHTYTHTHIHTYTHKTTPSISRETKVYPSPDP